MCVALAIFLDAMGIARYGGEVDPRIEGEVVLLVGTIMWILVMLFIRELTRVPRNRYLWRKRLDLWWERLQPLWPSL